MHLLVEEGKHGIATDKNGDGYFTPGYDVNVRVNDAWGVRDNMRTGLLVSGGFEPWMAKVRRPEHRVFPALPDDSPLRAEMLERIDGQPHAVYQLRPYPSSAIAGDGAVHAVGVALDGHLHRGGGEQDEEPDSAGGTVKKKKWDFVFETGLKFRVNVEHSPLKFLGFLTPYWGLRAGIKNRGFFDVNRLTYVLELGAGSF
jgi:hypothetical protein